MNDTHLLPKPFVVKNNDQNSILVCETSFFIYASILVIRHDLLVVSIIIHKYLYDSLRRVVIFQIVKLKQRASKFKPTFYQLAIIKIR